MKTILPFSIFLLLSLFIISPMSGQPYCDVAQSGPGFPSEPGCEAAVCSYDQFCCSTAWDVICATEASSYPACSACLAGSNQSIISGIVFIDNNCNGVMDAGDEPVENIDIISAGNVLTTSGSGGAFTTGVAPNSQYIITTEYIPGVISTSQVTINTPDSSSTFSGIEIAICPDVNYHDVSAYFYPDEDNPVFNYLPGDQLTFFIHIYNHSFVEVDAKLTYTFDSDGLNVTQLGGGQLNNNVVSWDITNLDPLSSSTYVINLIVLQEAESGNMYEISAHAELNDPLVDANPANDEQVIQVNVGTPPPNPTGGCDQPHNEAGYSGFPQCESVVCVIDPWCCSNIWDSACAALASGMPECAPCLQGATHSVVEGILFVDYNCNGSMDGNDTGLSEHSVESSVSGTIATSDGEGNFFGYIHELNSHDISPAALDGLTLPAPVTIVTPDSSVVYSGVDFGLCPVPDYQDVSVDLSVFNPSLFPAEEFSIQICTENISPWESAGVLTLSLNDSLLFVVDEDSGVIAENAVSWNITLNPYETICFDLELVVLASASVGTSFQILADFGLDSALPTDQNSGNNQDSQQISIGMPTVFSTYCDQSQSGPGFPGDLACQTAICASDAFCCNSFWDGICAGAASNEPACFYCLWSTNTSVVTGSTFLDLDCDGLFNNDDIIAANIPVQRNGQLMAVSNSIGEYSGLIEVNQNMLLSVDATAGFSINTHNVFSEEIETIHEIDFAFCPQGEVLNPGVTVSPVGLPPRPGFPVEYEVCVHNYSTTPAEVSVTFDFTNMLNTSVIDADSGIIGTSTINWNMIELGVFGSQCFSVTMQVQVGTPPGTILNPVVSVDAMPNPTADIDLSNNVHSFSHEVVAAYDPNDKVVDQPIVNFTEIEEGEGVELEYVIRFQNTGNFFATNVRVEDVLPELLDVNTIETIHASHDYELVIHPNNMVEWIFEDIMLPDSTTNEAESHGQIHFRITTVPDITLENVIENSASIYFDFKQPVVTEPAVTTFMDCSEGSLSIEAPEPICEGDLFELTSNRYDFDNYVWVINGQEFFGEEIDYTAFPDDEISIQLTATNAVCTLSTEITLPVSPQPMIGVIPEGFTVCGEGEELEISAEGMVSWYLDDQLVATGNTVVLSESGMYYITTENECGTTDVNIPVQIVDIPEEVTLTFDGEQLIVSPVGSDYVWLLDGLPVSIEGPAITPLAGGDYTVIVYFDDSYCSLTSNIVHVPVSVEEQLAAQIHLYPNPVSSVTTVSLPQGEWNISLLDASGKIIEHFGKITKTQFIIDVSAISGGIYFVKVEGSEASTVKKLVVE